MESQVFLYIYQICVLLWIMVGLGYWVMVANFMVKALQSKKMKRVAKKATQIMKLLNQSGYTRDIDPEFLVNNSKESFLFLFQVSLGTRKILTQSF